MQRLYPLQDHVLSVIKTIETGFYLTGGTAVSRGYLQHRYSDDLDFFVNDDERFELYGLCTRLHLSLDAALSGARSKAAGIFPADLARILLSSSKADWEVIRWADAPDPDMYLRELSRLGEQLILLG